MPEPKLSIVPCGDYTPETVRAALLAALDAVGGLDWVKPGMRIGIKLNLCAARKPEQAATTHPVMAAELTRLLRERGAEVVLGDSPGEPFTAVVLAAYRSALRALRSRGGELNRDFSHHTVESRTPSRSEFWKRGSKNATPLSTSPSSRLTGSWA